MSLRFVHSHDTDSSGIFWDNDSLAGLLALELKVDLLVLLSYVEGLYSGPPNDPISKLIHTYIEEKHQREITYRDKSRLGRGGMTAKVNDAICAVHAGIPVIITSGYATDNIIRVLQGEKMGTVFHKDAHLWKNIKQESAHEMAVAACNSSRRLQISRLAKSVHMLADMEELVGQILKRSEIAALAIRSGNGLLLKGGNEGRRSNAALHKVITSVMPDIVGDKLIGLVTSRDQIPDLLKILWSLEAVIGLFLKSRSQQEFQFLVMLMEFVMYMLTSLLILIWQSR
ncbi:delta-1-pyrroline-5-carboxylate synthase-like isoform X2 [Cicer arietinum]|uniref:delta-1-pyrroline-5-carboxylate synthase-like isoform X2 n=1 Tax=Cicer arietinum TaxID=3827 RepID=UPI003CC5B9CF